MEPTRLPRILDRAALFLVAFQIVLQLCVSTGGGLGLLILGLLWTAAALWLGARLLEGGGKLRLTGTEIPLAVFLVLSVLSIFHASYRLHAVQTATAFATLALLVPLGANVFAGRRELPLRLLLGSLFALSVYAFLQRFWILPALVPQWIVEGREQNIIDRAQSGEVWATFLGYPNAFAGFLAILLPIAVGLLIDTKKLAARVVCLSSAALGAVALWFTGSRGAWIAAAGGAVLFAALLSGRRAVLIGCAAACVVGAVVAGPRILHAHTMEIRAVYWSAALKIAKEHPVMGVGAGNFEDYYYQARDERQQETNRAHNDYLQVLAELGALGLLAYLAFIGLTVRSGLRPRDNPAPPPEEGSQHLVGLAIAAAILAAAFLGGVFMDVGAGAVIIIVLAAWVGVFAIARVTPGRATRFGLLAGFVAGCVHSLVDFDLYSPGTAATLFLGAALVSDGRVVEAGRRAVVFSFAGVALAALCLMAWLVPAAFDAEAALEEGRIEQAVTANPMDAENWAKLAEARTAAGDPSAAQAALDEAIRRRPRHAPYHWQKGQLYRQAGRYEQAREAYVRALELYPHRAPTHCALAEVLDRLGRSEEAVVHYRRALELEKLADVERLKLTSAERERALARTR